LGQRQSVNKTWKGLSVAIVSEIWNQRNKVVFRDGVVDTDEILVLLKLRAGFGLSTR